MKLATFLHAMALVFVFSSANAQSTSLTKKGTIQSANSNAASFFNGAWQGTMGESKSFSVMHDGYFNIVGVDLNGKWDGGDAGTYTVNSDSSITFKVLYSPTPDHIGGQNTAGYSIVGQTVKLRHFKKLLDGQGNDMTDQMPQDMVETLVRMK